MSATAYVAFDKTQQAYRELFNEETFRYIQLQILKITKDSDLNTPYIVPKQRIKEVIDSVWSYFRPNTGDIVTRYNINNESPYRIINYRMDIIKEVINVIINDIMNTVFITKNNNEEFSIWNTLSGNSRGMVHHPQIKLNERMPTLHFNMNF